MAKKGSAPRVDRTEKLSQLREITEALELRVSELDEQAEQRELLQSVTHGLYEETDKLSKKAPAEQVTELLLEQVNQVIGETKQLIKNDPYVQRLNQFVPAGDRPEHRDVVVILRMVLQALQRFTGTLAKDRPAAQRRLSEARVLEYATEQWQNSGVVIQKHELNEKFVKHADDWFVEDDGAFDFDSLDNESLKEYFDLE